MHNTRCSHQNLGSSSCKEDLPDTVFLGLKQPIPRAPPQTGKERWTGGFKHSPRFTTVTASLTPGAGRWDAAAGSLEAVGGGPQAGPAALPWPHVQAAVPQGGSRPRAFSESLQAGSNPRRSHFTPCPVLLFPS